MTKRSGLRSLVMDALSVVGWLLGVTFMGLGLADSVGIRLPADHEAMAAVFVGFLGVVALRYSISRMGHPD